jgi:Protein of unknown function (DUF1097)
MRFNKLTAGALAAAIIAAASVWIFAIVHGLLIWAAFIGWASYDQSGADRKALFTSSSSMVFGVIMAWLVAVSVAGNWLHLPSSTSSAIAAGIASFLIVVASRLEAVSNVPATFYGFASSFAFLMLAPHNFTTAAMTQASLGNVAVVVPTSLLIGSGLGVFHVYLSEKLTAPSRQPVISADVHLTPLAKPKVIIRERNS